MTKKELIAALANVNDDAVVLFGTKEIQFFGAFATQFTASYYMRIKRININRQGESPAQYRRI